MTDQRPLEWIQSMRLQLLDSLFELSSEYLQAASWINPTATNPHYTLIEFIESSPLRDMPLLEYHKATGVIRDDEYSILLPLVTAIAAYAPPDGDWYNHEAVLRDPNWLAITKLANSVLNKLLSLTFNSPQWVRNEP